MRVDKNQILLIFTKDNLEIIKEIKLLLHAELIILKMMQFLCHKAIY
jgi:hypothetical protein